MHNLDWLIGLRFQEVIRREFDWVFVFDDRTSLTVACLWRLIDDGRIARTCNDDGHKFGLPAPVNAIEEVNLRLAGTAIESVEVIAGVLDLHIHFGTKYSVQVLPDSSGYEAWDLCGENRRFIAVGGGQLAIFGDGRQNSE